MLCVSASSFCLPRCHPVADTAHGLDAAGIAELFAQILHMRIYNAGVAVVVISPELLQQMRPRDNIACSAHQLQQNFVFAQCQLTDCAVRGDLLGIAIDSHVADLP